MRACVCALLFTGNGGRREGEGCVLLIEGGVHLGGNSNPFIWTFSSTDSKNVSQLCVCGTVSVGVCVCTCIRERA